MYYIVVVKEPATRSSSQYHKNTTLLHMLKSMCIYGTQQVWHVHVRVLHTRQIEVSATDQIDSLPQGCRSCHSVGQQSAVVSCGVPSKHGHTPSTLQTVFVHDHYIYTTDNMVCEMSLYHVHKYVERAICEIQESSYTNMQR